MEGLIQIMVQIIVFIAGSSGEYNWEILESYFHVKSFHHPFVFLIALMEITSMAICVSSKLSIY
mgnify:CR=1 FL=1